VTSYRQPGTVLTDHTFLVPLDHGRPDGEQIEVFAREVVAAEKAAADLPWLLFLQGGPGFGSPRPIGRDLWLDRVLEDYRVLLLDQRGTGRSSPAGRLTLSHLGSPQAQADYLALFRADSIVLDAELIRRQLTGGAPWSVLGQSFGGFCTVTYLSFAPGGVREAFITGGLPGLDVTADDVYRAAYPRVAAKNAEHYERYPDDVERAREIARHLSARDVRLPGGAPLTVEGFQALGRMLGMSTGSHALHYMLEHPFAGGQLSDVFLREAESYLTFTAGPLYAVLHEACYAQGSATKWSAQRVRSEFPAFDPGPALDGAAGKWSIPGCSRPIRCCGRCARRPTSSPSVTRGRRCTTGPG
jgi:pimeloyl-ACP methyl ester carboxylesterase